MILLVCDICGRTILRHGDDEIHEWKHLGKYLGGKCIDDVAICPKCAKPLMAKYLKQVKKSHQNKKIADKMLSDYKKIQNSS